MVRQISISNPEHFYSVTGEWWGASETEIGEIDRARVELLCKVNDGAPGRLLELGCGFGATAIASAHAGFDVTAIELSNRVDFARSSTQDTFDRKIEWIKGDFYTTPINGPFDVVTYWNCLGAGSDADQRRLLKRISGEWLSDDGVALIDVLNPFVHARWDGQTDHKHAANTNGYQRNQHESTAFDPVQNRFIETWTDDTSSDVKVSQSIRAYTPADLRLLLETTGLTLESIYISGEMIDPSKDYPGLEALMVVEQQYLAVLRRTDSRQRS